MDRIEVASRLQEILNRNNDRKVNKLIPEDIRQLNICIAALTIPVVVGQSEQFYCEIHKEEMTYDTNVNEYFCWTCEHGQQ